MMGSSHNRNLAPNDLFQILSKELRWSNRLWKISWRWGDGMNSGMKDWDIWGFNLRCLQAGHELFMMYNLKCPGSLGIANWASFEISFLRWSCKYQKLSIWSWEPTKTRNSRPTAAKPRQKHTYRGKGWYIEICGGFCNRLFYRWESQHLRTSKQWTTKILSFRTWAAWFPPYMGEFLKQ